MRLDTEGGGLSISPRPLPDRHTVAWVRGQCFFWDGAHCSLTPLAPEPPSHQLLMRGAATGIGVHLKRVRLSAGGAGAESGLALVGPVPLDIPLWILRDVHQAQSSPSGQRVLLPTGFSGTDSLISGRRSGNLPARSTCQTTCFLNFLTCANKLSTSCLCNSRQITQTVNT